MVDKKEAMAEATERYKGVQEWFLEIIGRSQTVGKLERGILPYSNMQNVIYDFWLIVNHFPVYLELLEKRINLDDPALQADRQKYRIIRLVKKWVLANIEEEQEHKRMWISWAKEFDVSRVGLMKLGHTGQMRRLHRELERVNVNTNSSIYIPKALAFTSVGVEGMTGALIYRVFNGILSLYKRQKGKELSKRGREWLEVHFKEDFDRHPVQALALVLMTTPQQHYGKIMDTVKKSGLMYLQAFNAAGAKSYK